MAQNGLKALDCKARLAAPQDSYYGPAMTDFTLYIGSKAYSSWSLRGWLACKVAGIAFDEAWHDMGAADWSAWVKSNSPSGRVPMLQHRDQKIWESLAIIEYLWEQKPDSPLWPKDRAARAHARVIASEMHAGFADLRNAMWMNMHRRYPGKGRTPGALANIDRIVALWRETRTLYGAGGPFLFGKEFNGADVMYAPVASRFITWQPDLPDDAKAYVAAVWDHPFMVEWRKAAEIEKPVERYEKLAEGL